MKKLSFAIIVFISLNALMTSCNKTSDTIGSRDDSIDETTCVTNDISPEEESALSSDILSNEKGDEEITNKRNVVNPVIVNILNESGSLLEEYESVSDIDLNRPKSLYPNEVFTGWKECDTIKQVIDNTVDINSVISIESESIDISDDQNVIYNDAVYVSNDIPTKFTVPVSVGGETSFCALDLEIEYDSSSMEFVEFADIDADTICNCVAEENKINICFSSTANINGQLDLCNIIFKTIGTQAKETSLKYSVSNFAAWDDETSDFYNVRYNIIDGKIVMY